MSFISSRMRTCSESSTAGGGNSFPRGSGPAIQRLQFRKMTGKRDRKKRGSVKKQADKGEVNAANVRRRQVES